MSENTANDALSIIFNRKSVRKYKGLQVSDEQLLLLAKAAMCAPSSRNKQPWSFVIIKSQATLKFLAANLPYAKMLPEACSAIVVCGDLKKAQSGSDNPKWVQDCSAATQNILLAAEAIGLGAVWTAVFPNEDRIACVVKILKLPDFIMPLNVIAIGHPVGIEKPIDKFNLSNIHYEEW